MDADTAISDTVAEVVIITVAMKVMRMKTRDAGPAIDSDIVVDHVLVHHHRHTAQNVPQTPVYVFIPSHVTHPLFTI